MKIYKIYVIKNISNNKLYFGQTTKPLDKRFKQHCKPSSKCNKMKNAIQKYGKDKFTIKEVATTYNHNTANYLEKFFINTYNSTVNGYNIEIGGSPNSELLSKKIFKNKIKNNNFGCVSKRNNKKSKWQINFYFKDKKYSCELFDSKNDAKKFLQLITNDISKNRNPKIRLEKFQISKVGYCRYNDKKNIWRVNLNWKKKNYHADFCKTKKEAKIILNKIRNAIINNKDPWIEIYEAKINKSGGVFFDKKRNKWYARLSFKNKTYSKQYYNTKKETQSTLIQIRKNLIKSL